MIIRMEHANICVQDIEGMIQFLQTAFPDFRLRGEGRSEDGLRWIHVGTDETYIALNESNTKPETPWIPYEGRPGVNHLGYEVDDVASMRDRLKAAGYRESTPPNSHPYRKRLYFYDPDGNDWEFVEYLTADRAKRHDYKM